MHLGILGNSSMGFTGAVLSGRFVYNLLSSTIFIFEVDELRKSTTRAGTCSPHRLLPNAPLSPANGCTIAQEPARDQGHRQIPPISCNPILV